MNLLLVHEGFYYLADDEEDEEAEMEQVTPATAVTNGGNVVETRDYSNILSKIFTAALKNQDKSWCVVCLCVVY